MKLKAFLTICGIIVCSRNYAQNKIGYVSGEKIFAAMPETIIADSNLNIFQEGLVKSYTDSESFFNTEYAKFVKDSAAMSVTIRKTKYQELITKANLLASENNSMRIKIANEKQKSQQMLLTKMQGYVKEVATKNGFAHIIYDANAIVLNPADDITEEVIKKVTQK
jgi:Skp family chaperone for outer membrane proteins